jgi:alkylhydroperoxidase/carboxymuconolactone decarboxylase family protein YurZ
MATPSQPPQAFLSFVQRFPKVGQAWELLTQSGHEGPLDEKTTRLLKMAIAIGAMREGAVHASVRKAIALGISRAELEQVVALAASTIGLPSAVAAFSWISDELSPT